VQPIFEKNIEQGIAQKLYQEDINIESYVTFYFNLIFKKKVPALKRNHKN
jgi:hypothetical protein